MQYAEGTSLDQSAGCGRALCSDGIVRAVRVRQPDTFFSCPASTTVRGKTVTGFVMVSSRDGYDTATDDDPAVVKFTAYKYGKNGGLLP